jgi:hypothetical protein
MVGTYKSMNIYHGLPSTRNLTNHWLHSSVGSVGIATGYGMVKRGIEYQFPDRHEVLLSTAFRPTLGPTQPHRACYTMETGDSFPGSKAAAACWPLTFI